ncbi:MAG TPA: hypothetical protein VG078_05210 [Acidimicrobiales bacterium]|nr:hypothetical protein [Acidimicrobiales bacterium]
MRIVGGWLRGAVVAVMLGGALFLSAGLAMAAGPSDAVPVVYYPGQESGWHVHSGPHSVTVTEGSFTVYDATCAPRIYGPGETFVNEGPHNIANYHGAVARATLVWLDADRTATTRIDPPCPDTTH